MYITINDIKGEKTIDLSYSIHSAKECLGACSTEIAVIKVLSDNVQYKVMRSHIVNYISPEDEKLILMIIIITKNDLRLNSTPENRL